MSQLFLSLGFVRPNGVESEQLMLANVWRSIGGDENGKEQVPLKRAKVFMCGIQNFHIDWLIDVESPDASINGQSVGRIDAEGEYYLRSDEITYLTKKYHSLYQNRLDKLAAEKK